MNSPQHTRAAAERDNQSLPLYSLPDDVLVGILAEVHSVRRSFGVKHSEIYLSQVSRRWREVSINFPRFWSTIEITQWYSLDQLETYLSRSQQLLLVIDLTIGPVEIDEDAEDFEPYTENEEGDPDEDAEEDGDNDGDEIFLTILAALVAHVHRWRVLTIYSYSYPILGQIASAIQDLNAPSLEHFRMALGSDGDDIDRARTRPSDLELAFKSAIFMGGAPRLTKLQCLYVSIESCWPPIAALTDLRLDMSEIVEDGEPTGHPLTPARFHELITSVPNLQSLTLFSTIVALNGEALPSFTLPNLVALDVDTGWSPTYVSSLFSAMLTPSLSTLVLRNMAEETDEAFINVLRASHTGPKFPNITLLNLDGFSPDIPQIFFEHFPSVSTLMLSNDHGRHLDIAFKDLCGSDQEHGRVSWPKLKSVRMNFVDPTQAEILCNFLALRHRIGHPLESISLMPKDILLLREHNTFHRSFDEQGFSECWGVRLEEIDILRQDDLEGFPACWHRFPLKW